MGERLRWFIMYLISPLLNERGDVEIKDEDETKTDEELEASEDEDVTGEEEDVESDKDEDSAEDDSEKALKESDEEEEPPKDVPYARFKEVNEKLQKADKTQEKFDQFKQLGPEGYYKLYPDEKTGDEEDTETDDADKLLSMSEMAGFRVEGGPHDGKTLDEVAKEDPLSAMDIYNNYKDGVESQRGRRTQLVEDSEREIGLFITSRAKDAFGKDLEKLSEDESKQIESLVNEVTNWMVKTGRGGGLIEDGFYLMNREGHFEKTKSDMVKALVKILNDPGTATISSKKSSTSKVGYERFSSMTPEQVLDEQKNWTDEQEEDFLKKAPKSVRDKFPELPWA